MKKITLKKMVIIALVIFIILLIIFSIPFIQFIENPNKLRKYIDSFGVFAPLIFILLSMTQILIPFIPGEPFELLAGYSFGFIKGSLLCILAGSLASTIIIIMVKKYNLLLVDLFFPKNEYRVLDKLKSKKAFLVYSLLFIIPGTPKDLLCYFGGLADYDLLPLILITTIGRIPSIITSTFPANALSERKYTFAIIVYVITGIISILGYLYYKKRISDK